MTSSGALWAAPAPETAAEKIEAARRLIADAIPEERAHAEALIVEAIRLAPRSAEAYAELTRHRLWETAAGLRAPADLLEALDFADQVKSLAPERPLGDYLKCEIQFALSRGQEAMRTCQQAEEAFPHHVDTEVYRVRHLAESDPQRAAEAAQRALSLGASTDLISGPLSAALSKMAKEGSAGDSLSRFATVHPDRWMWHRAGLAYVAEKKPQEAEQAFRRAIALGNTLESRLQLAMLEQGQLKKPRAAAQEYRKLLEDLHSGLEAREDVVSGILARLSLALLDSNEKQQAVEAAHQAFVADPGNERLVRAIYEAFQRRKMAFELRGALTSLSSRNPFLVFAHSSLGELATYSKDFGTAIGHFSDAAALTPEDDSVFASRGHVWYAMGEFAMALRDFDTAIRNRPQEPTHHYNRACMLAKMGKEADALASLRTAILMDRSLAQVAHSDTDLAGMRESAVIRPQLAALGVFNEPENDSPGESAFAAAPDR